MRPLQPDNCEMWDQDFQTFVHNSNAPRHRTLGTLLVGRSTARFLYLSNRISVLVRTTVTRRYTTFLYID